MSLASGSRLGPYEIVALIGAGGMGEVYKARDTRLDRDVAVKVLPASFSQDADRLRRLEREARAASQLNHPNITAVHDLGQQDGAPYVVSELLEGETLRARLAAGPLPARKATDYAIQVAEGLAAAHEKGIVHRDLKPENLFLTEEGRVKILDFGLAKLVERVPVEQAQSAVATASEGTEPGVAMGTAGYMSPEQVRGLPVDHRSDIFSFGAVFYEMLSGRRAFRGGSAVETMSAILKEEPPDVSETNKNVSPALERLVRHCLEKTPAQRFQSARDLAYDLANLSAASDAVAGRPPAAEPSRLRRSAWIAAVLSLGLLAAGLLALRSARSGQPRRFRQLTFQNGYVSAARFAPDGQSVVYSAAWNGRPVTLFSLVPSSPESRRLDFPTSSLLSLSRGSEVAVKLGPDFYEEPILPGILARAPLAGGSPRELSKGVTMADWSPSGELALARVEAGKCRLEYPPGRVLFETAGWIGQLRFSKDGREIAFIDHSYPADAPGTIMLVAPSQKARPLTREWVVAEGLAWSPKGDEVWFTASERGIRRSLWAVRRDGKVRLLEDSPISLKLHDVEPRGDVLLTSEVWRSVLQGAQPGSQEIRDLTWLDFSFGMDVSNDGKLLLFEEWGEGGGPGIAYLRRFDGSDPVRLAEGVGLSFSPDGQWVALQTYATPRRLLLLPIGPGESRAVETGGLLLSQWARFLPDGKRIAFLAHEPGGADRVFLQDLSTGQRRALTPEGVRLETWQNGVSPDGARIAVVDPSGALLEYPAEGTGSRRLPGEQGDRFVRWSADGTAFFVLRRDGPLERVVRVDATAGRRDVWRELRGAEAGPTVNDLSFVMSPDGGTWFLTTGRISAQLFLLEGVR